MIASVQPIPRGFLKDLVESMANPWAIHGRVTSGAPAATTCTTLSPSLSVFRLWYTSRRRRRRMPGELRSASSVAESFPWLSCWGKLLLGCLVRVGFRGKVCWVTEERRVGEYKVIVSRALDNRLGRVFQDMLTFHE